MLKLTLFFSKDIYTKIITFGILFNRKSICNRLEDQENVG